MAESEKQDDVDPRHRLAQKYMQRAHETISAKEAERPKTQRQRPKQLAGKPRLADLQPSISSSTLLHGMMLMLVITAVLLVSTATYLLLDTAFLVGRAVALPVGILIFIGLSYSSAIYLGIVESTSHGHTEPDTALQGDWRDWFWTMPATWGVLLSSAGLGWLISRVAPGSTATIIGVSMWLGYPILQLSTLETGSFTSPISLPVLRTLATRPLIWMTFFAISFLLWKSVVWLGSATWRDPPFWTMCWMGPLTTVALLAYAWSLGQLARWLTIGGR